MAEVDPSFILAIEHRPKLTIIEAENIPVIDLSAINSPDPNVIVGLVADIGHACKEWGFFQVINHGVPMDFLHNVDTAARKFFAQTKEEKKKVRKDEENPFGYFDVELTMEVRDWKEVFDFIVNDPMEMLHESEGKEVKKLMNQWPEYPPELRKACQEYAREIEKLSYKLMGLVSLSLGLAVNRLSDFFKDHASFIRLNHYPPCPVPHLALGFGRHTDGGALTVLAQDDVGGLEVKRKTDGEWIRVKPDSDAFIINVGDKIQVWSNGKYESVEHRVMVNSEKDRFSIPFFFNPARNTIVEPLEELTNGQKTLP